jgi:hypothetical protein
MPYLAAGVRHIPPPFLLGAGFLISAFFLLFQKITNVNLRKYGKMILNFPLLYM